MAITHQASSGVEVATSNKGTTSTTVAYVGVAAGRLGILVATLKADTATFGTVTGWTPLLDVAGGAAEVVTTDAGPTRLGVWYRDLDGSEAGNVTITATGTPDCLVGALSVYTVDAGWDPLVYVTGSDAAHAAAFSATAGAWSESLAADDLLVIARSSDNDGIGAKASFILTQAGATFGTIEYRNNRLNSSAADCCVASWDALVTAGSANAPTFGHGQTATNCGALAVVRIREAAAGSVTGDLAATLPTLTSQATGALTVSGGIAAGLPTLAAQVAGGLTVAGGILAAMPALDASVSGTALVSGDVSAVLPPLTDAELLGVLSAGGQLGVTLPALAFAGSDGMEPLAAGPRITTTSPTGPTTTAASTGRITTTATTGRIAATTPRGRL